RVGEQAHQQLPLAALARTDRAVGGTYPAAVPAVLVLPFLRIPDARLGLDVVEPRVLHAGTVRPDVLAGDRAGVAADALVQVQHHADLCTDLHLHAPFAAAAGATVADVSLPCTAGSSSQSTRAIFRTTTNSSRFVPIVP